MASPTAPIGGEGAIGAPATAPAAYKNPFLWVPSSYFTMGLVYVTVGQDLSIGYAAHDPHIVELYLTESFTFRVLEAVAAVRMAR